MQTAISDLATAFFQLQQVQPARNFDPRVNNKKSPVSRMIMIATISLASMTIRTPAYAHEACSNSTLNGDYASTVSGQLFHSDGTSEIRQGLVMSHFNGHGHFTQTDYVLNTLNGITSSTPGPIDAASGFQDEESGTYQVNPDCTGNLTINFAPPPVPGATGAIIKLFFVLGSHGNWMRTVVVSVTPPSVVNDDITGFTLHSEGTKLGQHDSGN
jgi:hypothetical protein